MASVRVEIFRIYDAEMNQVEMPTRAYDGDAGWDLQASESVMCPPGAQRIIKLGVKIAPSNETWFMLTPRSSMWKKGLMCPSAIIDSGFRGELFANFYNTGTFGQQIERGERIVQLVPFAHTEIAWQDTMDLPESERGEAGIGSSGK